MVYSRRLSDTCSAGGVTINLNFFHTSVFHFPTFLVHVKKIRYSAAREDNISRLIIFCIVFFFILFFVKLKILFARAHNIIFELNFPIGYIICQVQNKIKSCTKLCFLKLLFYWLCSVKSIFLTYCKLLLESSSSVTVTLWALSLISVMKRRLANARRSFATWKVPIIYPWWTLEKIKCSQQQKNYYIGLNNYTPIHLFSLPYVQIQRIR